MGWADTATPRSPIGSPISIDRANAMPLVRPSDPQTQYRWPQRSGTANTFDWRNMNTGGMMQPHTGAAPSAPRSVAEIFGARPNPSGGGGSTPATSASQPSVGPAAGTQRGAAPIAPPPVLPPLPGGVKMPTPISRNASGAAIANLGGSVNIRTGDRATLGGPQADNEWERMAAGMFGSGDMIPGAGQFQGKELADSVFTPEQVNQMAQQRAAPTIRALNDESDMVEEAARMGGGRVTPQALAMLRAKREAEGAGAINSATRDAQLDAAQANAEQAARSAANKRENFGADLAARTQLGGLRLNEAGQLLEGGLKRRGMDQDRDTTRYQGDVTQRGQDIGANTSAAEITAGNRRAAASAALEQEANKVAEAFGITDRALTQRGQDLGARAGDTETRMQAWKTGGDWGQQAAERQNRLQMLDAQLADNTLDRNTRAQLERERMQLQSETDAASRAEAARQFDVSTAQRGSQFDQQLGLNRDQFAKDFGLRTDQFGENKRQFDATQQFAGEQARADRNMRRQVAGVAPTPAPIPGGFRFTQPYTEDGTPRTVTTQDMQMQALLRAIQQLGQKAA